MKQLLFKKAFEKAEEQSGRTTKNGLSNHLEKVLLDTMQFQTSQMTFVRYYEKYIENNAEITSSPKSDLLNKLSEFLDYKNYEDFIKHNKQKDMIHTPLKSQLDEPDDRTTKERILLFIKKHKVAISLSIATIILFLLINSFNKQRWMIWQENEYIEVKFDTDTYNLNQLKLYKEERIKHFRKIKPTCDTVFFNGDGSPRVWYGKNREKELEYFTDLGRHPETGETLKKITHYMIDHHICTD